MNDNGYIVCGWYTPSYAHWAESLISSLDVVGEPHDIVAVDAHRWGWERQTLRKPAQILQAMLRHPDKTIIFLDVDCVVRGSLAPLADTRGDIAIHLVTGRRVRGYGRLFGRSGTMVIRQTPAAKVFMTTWANLSAAASYGYVDQHTLTEAIATTPGLVVEHLDVKWCAMAKDQHRAPVILHDGASRFATKIPAWQRAAHSLLASARWRTA